jgi:hypothetical protein
MVVFLRGVEGGLPMGECEEDREEEVVKRREDEMGDENE